MGSERQRRTQEDNSNRRLLHVHCLRQRIIQTRTCYPDDTGQKSELYALYFLYDQYLKGVLEHERSSIGFGSPIHYYYFPAQKRNVYGLLLVPSVRVSVCCNHLIWLIHKECPFCDQLWPYMTSCDHMTRFDLLWPCVTRDDRLWPDGTGVTRSDRMWPDGTGVTRSDQMWP